MCKYKRLIAKGVTLSIIFSMLPSMVSHAEPGSGSNAVSSYAAASSQQSAPVSSYAAGTQAATQQTAEEQANATTQEQSVTANDVTESSINIPTQINVAQGDNAVLYNRMKSYYDRYLILVKSQAEDLSTNNVYMQTVSATTDDVQSIDKSKTYTLSKDITYQTANAYIMSKSFASGRNKEASTAMDTLIREMILYSTDYRSYLESKYTVNPSSFMTQEDADALTSLFKTVSANKTYKIDGQCPAQVITDAWSTGSNSLQFFYNESIKDADYVQNQSAGIYSHAADQPLSMFYSVDETALGYTTNTQTARDLANNVQVLDSLNTTDTTETVDTQSNAPVSSYAVAAGDQTNQTTQSNQTQTANTSTKIIELSENEVIGIAYSSEYIPMQTNVYSADIVSEYDADWLRDYHYKYGFMRKALFRNTSATAAMDYYNSSGMENSNTVVCTMRDILECGNKDLVLYVDHNFYNADKAVEDCRIKLLETSANVKASSNATSIGVQSASSQLNDVNMTTVPAGFEYTMSKQAEAFNKDMLKTGDTYTYDDSLRSRITAANGEYKTNCYVSTDIYEDSMDALVLSNATIDSYLSCVSEFTVDTGSDKYDFSHYMEYTPTLSTAYVSAIYRNKYDYMASTVLASKEPVFIASDDVVQEDNATQYDRNSLLNYMLVKNLPSMAKIDYNYVLDLDKPIYMDIYGNILSESGTVVVPAASNATLFSSDYSNEILGLGLFSCYGKDYTVPADLKNAETVLSQFFHIDEENNIWTVGGSFSGYKSNLVPDFIVDFANLSLYTPITKYVMVEHCKNYIMSENLSVTMLWPLYITIINEVMRGAPITNIHKDQEGLICTDSNRAAIVVGVKLEELQKSLAVNGSSSLIALPDFSKMDHTEYIVAFLLKLFIACTLVTIFIVVYRDSVSGILGIRTIFKSLSAIALTVIAIVSVPALFQLTYYTANKLFLQKEAATITLYNLEKQESGVEIGMTETTTPTVENDMLIQLDWIAVPWYDEVNTLLFGSATDTVSTARDKAYAESAISMQDDVKVFDDGVYVSVKDLFDSVTIDYTFNSRYSSSTIDPDSESEALQSILQNDNKLYYYSNDEEQTLGFYSPYYFFLQGLISNINSYNFNTNTYSYTTKLQSGSRLKTIGLSQSYFESKHFMEDDEDILHLHEVYGLPLDEYGEDKQVILNDLDIASIQSTLWYNNLNSSGLEARIKAVNDACRDFVAENRDLLTKVSDETFIKVMALTAAFKYNQVFGISSANCYELYQLDCNDLLRLCTGNTADAMLLSPLSYARYVTVLGGEASVYAAAVLTMVMYVGSFVKPACIIIAYFSVFLSIFVFKVLLRRQSASIYGYLCTMALLGGTNFLHAIVLKACTYLPKSGLPMFGCIVFIIVFQVTYLLSLSCVTGVALRDWVNLGYSEYSEMAIATRNKLHHIDTSSLKPGVADHKNNWDYYDDLKTQYNERNSIY